ncbi:MAG: type IV pilus biogenesis/stability protein PilW [Gammaproteobacteria bacterium]
MKVLPRSCVSALCVVALLSGCVTAQNSTSSGAKSANKRKIAELNTQIAIQHLKDKEYELALNKLEKASDTDPSYPDAYNTRGIVYSQLGEVDKADSNFERALRLDNNNPLTLNNYGQFLCQNGDAKKGQEMFKRATANPLYRTPEIALTNAGTCALNEGNAELAESYFREALDVNPRIPVALLQMASITYDSGRYLPARAYIQRYSEISNHVPRSLWLGILIERELGDQDAEASYALSLEKHFPDSKEAGMLGP